MRSFFIVAVITFLCKLPTNTLGDDYDYYAGEEVKYFDLRGKLRQSFALEAVLLKPHSSIICSPISALLPIGKLALGAEGKTLDELIKAVGVQSDFSMEYETSIEGLEYHFKIVLSILQFLPGVILDLANKLYVSNKYRLRSKFSKLAKSIFNSSVEEVDFEDTQRVLNNINGWVASETHGMIPSILSSNDISSDSSLIVVNAIYFAGKWKYPFPWVNVGTFHSAHGTREIPMMSHTMDYEYTFSTPLMAQIINIPYHGNKASFLLILPKERNELDLVMERLKNEPNLLSWAISKMEKTRLKLTMPKFKIESEWNLRELYKKIGISTIFKKDKSQLKNIVKNETLVVSAAIQKAVIEVNEFGTEAAASSAISIVNLSYMEPIVIKADHPFLFYVLGTNQQLFSGVFKGPS